MWILIRIIAALVTFVAGMVLRRREAEKKNAFEGRQWLYREDRNKNHVTAVYCGLPFKRRAFFELTHEGSVDGFFKSMGISQEFQTGDDVFDMTVYIACDHPAINAMLSEDEKMRAAIVKLFASGAKKILADGENVWVEVSKNVQPTDEQLRALYTLADGLNVLEEKDFTLLQDPYVWKAFAASSLVWSIMVYGIMGGVDSRGPTMILDGAGLMAMSVKTGVILFLAFIMLILFWLHNSSRMHRVLVESFWVLLLGLAFASPQIVKDLNVALDKSAAVQVAPRVLRKESHYHSGKHSYYSYHVKLEPAEIKGGERLPSMVTVEKSVYDKANGGHLAMNVRKGALGLAWVERMAWVPKP